jgi:hypothetical protein
MILEKLKNIDARVTKLEGIYVSQCNDDIFIGFKSLSG